MNVLNKRQIHHRLANLHYTALLAQIFATGNPQLYHWAVTGVTNTIRKQRIVFRFNIIILLLL